MPAPGDRRSFHGRRWRATLSALTAAVLLGACGASQPSSTSTAQRSPSASAPATSSTAATTTTTPKRAARRHAVAKKPSRKATPKPATQPKSHKRHATSTTTSTTPTTTTTPKATKPVLTRPMHATLVGENHHPTVNKKWFYTVTATDAKGHLLTGTVEIEFALGGTVVGKDTPPMHKIKDGRWRDNLKFPPQSVGYPLNVQAVVHTSLGTVTLDWAIKVRQ